MMVYAVGSWLITLANIVFWVLILRQRHVNRVARSYFGWTVFITLWSIGYGITLSGLLDYDVTLAWNRWCQAMAALIAPYFFRFVCLVVRQEAAIKRFFRWYLLLSIINSFGLLLHPSYVVGLWSFGVFRYQPLGGVLYPLFTGGFWLITLHAYWIGWRQLRRFQGMEREKVKLFLAGTAIAYSGAGTLFLQGYHIPLPSFGVFLVLTYVIVIGYLVYRYQFFDVRIVISRTLVYSTLVACITATYLVMVLAMEKWFQGFFGYRSIFATAVVAFLIAIFFNPVRERIQAFVDRWLFTATPIELAAQREQLLTEVRKGDQMKAVATLAAGLAHEIKNPLASIRTFTEYLDSRYNDPEFRSKFQKIVGGEVERINLIVQQLLEFAKPMPPKLEPLEVPRVVDETLEFLNNDFVQRHVDVSRCYDTTARVLGDPQQLKQVFLNLFLNSLDAMNGHGRLKIRTAVEGSELTVAIADSGAGIAPKDLPHIFEPFYTTKANGTGLGLAVVHGIIKEHGGRIEVQSHPGQGTTMRIHLPIAV